MTANTLLKGFDPVESCTISITQLSTSLLLLGTKGSIVQQWGLTTFSSKSNVVTVVMGCILILIGPKLCLSTIKSKESYNSVHVSANYRWRLVHLVRWLLFFRNRALTLICYYLLVCYVSFLSRYCSICTHVSVNEKLTNFII